MNQELAAALKKAKQNRRQHPTVDVYRECRADRELKYIDAHGNEHYGYVYSPEFFVTSAATGRQCRFYIDLGNGLKVHPDELSRVQVRRDGSVIITETEHLRLEDYHINKRALNVPSMREILRNVTIYGPQAVGRDDDEITVIDKDTGRSHTMTRKEWKAVRLGNREPTFSEWLDRQVA